MRVTLAPIVHRDGHVLPVERELLAYLGEVLFDPLRRLVSESGVRMNAKEGEKHSALWDALLAGTIWYARGIFSGFFSGTFNAEVSRELRALGAVKRGETFVLAREDIPIALRGVIVLSEQRSAALHKTLLTTLDRITETAPVAPTGISLKKAVDKIAEDLQSQFVQSASGVEGLKIPTALPQGLTDELYRQTTLEIDRSIKQFTVEATQKLREQVRRNLTEGGRTERLARIIEAEFGVAHRKARFLADQETSLLVSRFRESRYRDIGSGEYVWETVGDDKVRPTHGESNNHRVLNGRKFSWDAPPVVDTATGRRCHPGEDYGPCRCIARPVIVIS